MEHSYQLNTLKISSSGDSSLEVCAKMLSDDGASEMIQGLIKEDTTLYIQGDLKGYNNPDIGYEPASNFREKDRDSNNKIVRNWMNLFKTHQSIRGENAGIVCTSIPRTERYFTIQMHEDGSMKVHHNSNQSVNTESTEILQNFLQFTGITQLRVLTMRESSKSANYRTYLADLQAFLLAVNFKVSPEMFEDVFMTPTLINSSDKELLPDGSTLPILREKKLPRGKVWTPENKDYLYFVESEKRTKKYCSHSQKFYYPKQGVISKIYYQMNELLKNEENGVKRLIRESYFDNLREWNRWSDYWVNDIDDAVTILAIIHAFSFCSLTAREKEIKATLELITKPWFEKFALAELRMMEPEPEPEQ